MNTQLSKEELQKRVKEIDALYQEYLGKLNGLKVQQNKILKEFIQKLEQKKLVDIRKSFKS